MFNFSSWDQNFTCCVYVFVQYTFDRQYECNLSSLYQASLCQETVAYYTHPSLFIHADYLKLLTPSIYNGQIWAGKSQCIKLNQVLAFHSNTHWAGHHLWSWLQSQWKGLGVTGNEDCDNGSDGPIPHTAIDCLVSWLKMEWLDRDRAAVTSVWWDGTLLNGIVDDGGRPGLWKYHPGPAAFHSSG